VKVALFLDLDDTVFQTRPKCPPGEPVRPAAFGRDRQPLGFRTDRQSALLDLMFGGATVIPTTARNFDAYRRVDLPFSSVAIINFGGVVLLPDGAPDPEWDARVRPRALALAAELLAIHREAERVIAAGGLGVVCRVISDFDMPLYVVAKHPAGDAAALDAVQAAVFGRADPDAYFVHRNGNNLSLVPRFLGKERAVAYVIERHLGPGPVLTIGAGDSLTDAPFLALCDFSLMPRGCQLARRWSPAPRGG